MLHDPDYERAIPARYLDPLELVWLSTGRRLGLRIRRDARIFSMTDGQGNLWLGTRETLDPDDSLCQMLFHEICHWITNGADSYHARDWGFPLWDGIDPREHACLRLQAALADRVGLRQMFGPTGIFRQYYDAIGPDALAPLDDSPWEATVVGLAQQAVARADGPPWAGPVMDALRATAALHAVVAPFLPTYQTELDDDPLPSLWAADPSPASSPATAPPGGGARP